ncbi:Cytochrome c biogenesis protein CcsA [Pirellulimonas nuda]|uniref:Cytochrome c biogenesis protein CcsA n=1 Tax=Pirellulimonas nuda TaxID=2528009 RepID=A0A518DB09_9BACT|nr:cytochrome c biogenesis protein CcsA [Pirellulimonas nuda]QDU88670.1 Cytochrome c biogenesis protein CcsA [Pirellulimonas nuda]
MATAELDPRQRLAAGPDWPDQRGALGRPTGGLIDLLRPLASLRLTVFLFALSAILVFVGTLAQVDRDIWYVVNDGYFRVWLAKIEPRALMRFIEKFVYDFDVANDMRGDFWLPFPGGWTIGAAMFVNLLAAHALRFKVNAKGGRLVLGLATIALGVLATGLVIRGGMDEGLQSQLDPAVADGLWQSLRFVTAGAALAGAYWLVNALGRVRMPEWWIVATLVALVASAAAFLLLNPEWRLSDSGLRILWQLIQGGGAALLLLAGCWLAFRKRAGIVLLHGGVGLLMLSEFYTGMTAVETRMNVPEGGASSVVYNPRKFELAFIDRSPADVDLVTVVPEALLQNALVSGEPISHPDLPCDLRVARYFDDSRFAPPATDIAGQIGPAQTIGVAAAQISGPVEQRFPGAYVELLDKSTGKPMGVVLVTSWGDETLDIYHFERDPGFGPMFAQWRSDVAGQTVQVDGKPYAVALRMERTYKPYSITLKDFSFDRYIGTQTAKGFSSLVQLEDPSANIDREVNIYMNNPLRYGGDTLYQSNFDKLDEKTSVFQVVANEGWMVPYVSCMLVGVGMAAHFLITLGRFLGRRVGGEHAAVAPAAAKVPGPPQDARRFGDWLRSPIVWFPLLMALLAGGYVLSKARPPKDQAGAMRVQAFGALPVVEGGRVKPFDTLARTTLQVLSNRQEVAFEEEPGDAADPEKKVPTIKIPAAEWLLETIAGTKRSRAMRVFRIDNLDLLDDLGLPRRTGSFRYSLDDLAPKMNEVDRQIGLARQAEGEDPEGLSLYQRKVLELSRRLSTFTLVVRAYGSPNISGDDQESVLQNLSIAQDEASRLRTAEAPRAVPPAAAEGEWRTLFEAELINLVARATGQEANPAAEAYNDAFRAYQRDDKEAFNSAVYQLAKRFDAYQEELDERGDSKLAPAERLSETRVRFEQFYNAFAPLVQSSMLYVLAFLLAAASWLGWSRPLSRASTAVIFTALAFHTFAIVARIYISGRPPVTSLYSSAVFIGWASVLFAVSMETIYRLGIGNVMASIIGFLTLLVAYFLSLDSDTFEVLQAVLDTQFWLATHVVCITLGYSTTLLAGFLAAGRLISGSLLESASPGQLKDIDRMTYGTLCFAILFSFIGTVLGGLWADDSWGRFWGWDPKENGALLIVIWNALVLHARWGKLTGPIGIASLAVLGNIVTAWSWFGTNELGVGLHTYGFTEGRSQWLMIFAVSQLAIAAIAWLPKRQPSVGGFE